MINNIKEAAIIIAKVMQEYTHNKVNKDFMDKSTWLTSEDRYTFEFELMDMTEAEAFHSPEGQICPTGWKTPSKHLLTVYLDKNNGSTFVRRCVDKYPWE